MEMKNEFNKAKELMKQKKYEEAERIIKKLCSFSPRNLAFKFEYAKLLVKHEDTEQKGIEILEDMLNTWNRNYALLELGKKAMNNGESIKAREYFSELINSNNEDSKALALKELIYLEISEKKYIEAYRLFEQILEYKILKSSEINKISFYLKYQLNLLTEEDIKNAGYFGQQLINYNYDVTIEHLTEKLNQEENNNLDVYKLMEDSKNRIEHITPDRKSLVDKYIIAYEYPIYKIDDHFTNTMEVVTYPNTKTILTLNPTNEKSKSRNNINEDKIKIIKRESQIDKFNRKYNLG